MKKGNSAKAEWWHQDKTENLITIYIIKRPQRNNKKFTTFKSVRIMTEFFFISHRLCLSFPPPRKFFVHKPLFRFMMKTLTLNYITHISMANISILSRNIDTYRYAEKINWTDTESPLPLTKSVAFSSKAALSGDWGPHCLLSWFTVSYFLIESLLVHRNNHNLVTLNAPLRWRGS